MKRSVATVLLSMATCVSSAALSPLQDRPARHIQVTIDFVAVNTDGHPVIDLRADEISVKIGGENGTVRSLRAIPAADGRSDRISQASVMPFGSPESTTFERSFLVVIDDESIPQGSEQSTRDAVRGLVNGLAPRDRIGLVTIPHGGVRVPLTLDHGRVAREAGQVSGRGSRRETAVESGCRSRNSLVALTSLIRAMGSISTTGPLTVVFFSAGMSDSAGPAGAPFGTVTACELQSSEFRPVGLEAALARAYFYIVQPEIFETAPSETRPRAGLEHLAGVTGGRILQLSGREGDLLRRVSGEMSSVYVADVELDALDRIVATYALSVKTARRGVTIHARPDVAMATARVVAVDSRLRTGLLETAPDLLNDRRAFTDLPLRGIVVPTRGTRGDVAVLGLFEVTEAGTVARSTAVGIYATTGQLIARWVSGDGVMQQGLLAASLQVPPGVYRVRAAAIADDGRRGTVDYDVRVELTAAGALTLGGMTLGIGRVNGFEPRLQFSNEPTVTAYVELYGRLTDAEIEAAHLQFEIATTSDGPALRTAPGRVARTSIDDRLVVSGAIPVGDLPPGDFVVRALIGVNRESAGV
ncbi:MAG: hypothetical protein ABI652_07300, partial [Acidobacteriota bacterium]